MKTLVLCVDRDNDIGEKTSMKGPIIGYADNLRAAQELGLADPEDTDLNAIYEAVKIAKELGVEVVTLTGDRQVGLISDEKISDQIDRVIKKFKPKSVILVTDGAEDEQVIPIIQSRVKINSIKTVIVRQSKELEKAYFTITNFLREVEKDPNLAHIIFVIPGLILLLIAIGAALNILLPILLLGLAIIGVYFIIKGLGLEEEFFSRVSEFVKSISIERISIFAYLFALIILVAGAGLCYEEYMKTNPDDFIDKVQTALTLKHVDWVLLAVVIAVVGRIIDEYHLEKHLAVRRYIITLALIVLVTLNAQAGARYMLEYNTLLEMDFLASIFLSAVFFFLIVKATELVFIEEIKERKRWIKAYANKRVINTDGIELGKVSRVLLDDHRFRGIRLGKKRIEKDDIISNGDIVIVQSA